MSFLSPTLLGILIPLVGLPLVLHLLNKGFPRYFKFPSIELIKETMARRSKFHRWRHWILLLLRTIFLLLMLLAFLQPLLRRFGTNPADHAGRQVLIVLDHSVSMEHKGDGPTSRERALYEASKLMDSLGPDDTVNLLLMEPNPATCFVSFSADTAEAKRFLNRLKPGFGRADVNLANAAAARLFSQSATRPEIYYISDFGRKKWANASFTALPPAVKLFFVDVGPAHRDNRAILDARPSQTEMLSGDTVPIEITVGNFSPEPFAGRVTVTLDKRFSFDQEVSIAPWSQEKVTVPVSVGGPGVHLCEVRLPPDALEYDNHFFLTLAVQAKEEVLIVSDGTDGRRSGAYYLKTALNPFENDVGSLLPRIISSGDLSPARLAGVQKMFFTHVNRLSPEASDAVAKFLFQGGGLVYFLDGTADVENLAALGKIMKGVFVGLVEVKGTARCDAPLVSRLAEVPCVHYGFVVEEHWRRTVTYTDSEGRTKRRTESGWTTVDQGGASTDFILQDATGGIRLEVARATWEPETVFERTCGPDDPLYYGKGPRESVRDSTEERRFSEVAVRVGSPLYVLASARIAEDAAELELGYEPQDGTLFISTRPEEAILRRSAAATVALALMVLLMTAMAAVVPVLILRHGRRGAGPPERWPEGWPAWVGEWWFAAAVGAAAGAALLTLAFAVLARNGLVRLRERLRRARSLVDVQLRRRADLIPAMEAATRGAQLHERDLQPMLAALRATAAAGPVARLVESMPVLRADAAFQRLFAALVDCEDRLALARSFEVASMAALRIRGRAVPDGVLARLMGFRMPADG